MSENTIIARDLVELMPDLQLYSSLDMEAVFFALCTILKEDIGFSAYAETGLTRVQVCQILHVFGERDILSLINIDPEHLLNQLDEYFVIEN